MKFKTVSYRRNAEVAPFCHEHVECMIELQDGDDAEACYATAKEFVLEKLGQAVPAAPRRRSPKST